MEDCIAFQFRNNYDTEWHYDGYDYLQTLEGSKDGIFYLKLEGSKGTYQAPLRLAIFILKNGRREEELKQKWRASGMQDDLDRNFCFNFSTPNIASLKGACYVPSDPSSST